MTKCFHLTTAAAGNDDSRLSAPPAARFTCFKGGNSIDRRHQGSDVLLYQVYELQDRISPVLFEEAGPFRASV